MRIRPVIACLCCVLAAAPAYAQIYSWRDADGKLVLSDKPKGGNTDMVTYAPSSNAAVVVTKPVLAASHKSEQFEPSISEHSRRLGVSADLVRAVIQVESAFNPYAVSNKGAMG